MQVDDFTELYEPGSTVISPYGLAVIQRLYNEPLKERPERPGDGEEWPDGQESPNFAAARIYVNGHGEETIELDKLVPATPEAMARWNFTTETDAKLDHIADSLEDLVKQQSIVHDLELRSERRHGKTRRRQT